MKSFSVVLVLIVATCSASANILTTPEKTDTSNSLVPLPLQRQQLDLYGSSTRLIEQIVERLRSAVREVLAEIASLTNNIEEEASAIRDEILSDIQKLRGRVSSAIENVRNRLIDSGVAVVDCIASQSGDANALFNVTVSKALNCVDEQIIGVQDQIAALKDLADSAVEFGEQALENMRKCSEEGATFIATTSCLGSIIAQTDIKTLGFATQSLLTIGHISLSIATLPASLEVCAGSRLVEAGLSTAKILMEIGTCSAASIFSTMTGSSVP